MKKTKKKRQQVSNCARRLRYKDEEGNQLPVTFTPHLAVELDGRRAAVKELRRRIDALRTDAGCDSVQKCYIADRAAFIVVQLETMEYRAVHDKEFNPGVYGNLTNTLVGLLKALGLQKARKPVPSVEAYVRSRAKERG